MIENIFPTPCLRKKVGVLEQRIIVKLSNPGSELEVEIGLGRGERSEVISTAILPVGESEHDIFIPEPATKQEMTCFVRSGKTIFDQRVFTVTPPKHWRVHVVQLSHHDLGYTGLPSNVLSKHLRYLDQAIDMVDATKDFPEDAKFRLTVEQTWSVDYFLKNAPADRVTKLVELMRNGDFELTALYGNMITEICGHESLIRSIYPAFRLKRKYGIPIITAEHNDITGISWGLCRLLTDVGIKLFCPGLPLYYGWCDQALSSFWNQEAIFGFDDCLPGAFWWESATGKKLLFWCNNSGCGGSADPCFPGLLETLNQLEYSSFPGTVLRWPTQGGARDNSPYIIGFADSIKTWNEKWEYPRLVSSTNAKFYEEFSKNDLSNLPVRRGELPGQDYPVGATSTARATATARNNHHNITTAEALAQIAGAITNYEYQAYELENAWQSVLIFEEHAWGHTYSHGPAMDGAEAEKAVNAYRAASYAHDIKQKALAKIADNLRKESDDIHLMVFNPVGFARNNLIRVPMREIENSEIIMRKNNGVLTASSLPGRTERTHLPLPKEMLDGNFALIDTNTGEEVDFELVKISSDASDSIYAAQRCGLARGREEYFNRPGGWDVDLCFVAKNLPALGYKTYRLQAKKKAGGIVDYTGDEDIIENEFYRVVVNHAMSAVVSIFDKECNRELVDPKAAHAFGELVVREPSRDFFAKMTATAKPEIFHGKIVSSITLRHCVHGHPAVCLKLLLYAGIKRIDLAVKILKNSTPLLDAHLAFPFAAESPKFRYEGALNILEPVKDFLPGAYSDALAVQNWVEMRDGETSVLLSGHDAPVAALGELWPGYVSPAHACVIPERMKHSPQFVETFKRGWIYSSIFNNNFCTNFSATQSGEFGFRYSITTRSRSLSKSRIVKIGLDMTVPAETIFSPGILRGNLPLDQEFIKIENDNIVLLSCKRADEGNGSVIRFWNPNETSISSKIEFPIMKITDVYACNPAEGAFGRKLKHDNSSLQLEIAAFDIMTILVLGTERVNA